MVPADHRLGKPGGSGLQIAFAGSTMSGANAHNTSRGSTFLTPYMYVGDYIEVMTYQSSGGALNTSVGAASGLPFFTIILISG